MYRGRSQESLWFAIVLFITIFFVLLQVMSFFPVEMARLFRTNSDGVVSATYVQLLYLILIVMIWVLYYRVRRSHRKREEGGGHCLQHPPGPPPGL